MKTIKLKAWMLIDKKREVLIPEAGISTDKTVIEPHKVYSRYYKAVEVEVMAKITPKFHTKAKLKKE